MTLARGAALLKACCVLSACLLAACTQPAAAGPGAPAAADAGQAREAAPLSRKADGAAVGTDHKAYAEPPLPQLPAAGGKYVDPVFGTTIMRVTDERDGRAPGLGTYYPHWPTFNRDNTLLLIRNGVSGDAVLKRFDPERFELVGRGEAMPLSMPGSQSVPSWESSIWSNKDPNVIYTFSNWYTGGMRLYAYRVRERRFELLKDFTNLGTPLDYLAQMSMSSDDDVFAFSQRRSGSGEPVSYLVWRRSDDRVLAHKETGGQVDEVRIDKSGRYLAVGPNTPITPNSLRGEYLDLQTGRAQATRWNETERPSGHGDLGTGFVAGFDGWADGIGVRSLADPRRPRMVFRFTDEAGRPDWTEEIHGSLLADNEGWLTLSTFDVAASTLPDYHVFEDEIFQVALDGSGRVRRICHTRSRVTNADESSGYFAGPKPTISRDGRFIAYTSNWEASGRTDLFVVKIEPAPPISMAWLTAGSSPGAAPAARGDGARTRPRRVSGKP
ncbi:MAG: hypothetical protein ABW208_17910 [Pyrinomonadaceae bacterium]